MGSCDRCTGCRPPAYRGSTSAYSGCVADRKSTPESGFLVILRFCQAQVATIDDEISVVLHQAMEETVFRSEEMTSLQPLIIAQRVLVVRHFCLLLGFGAEFGSSRRLRG